jgi:hypothetical protein
MSRYSRDQAEVYNDHYHVQLSRDCVSTQRNLLSSCRSSKGLSRRFHAQRLMRSPIVVKAAPIADHSAGVLRSLEAVSVHALVLERSYHALHQAILLGRVRCDELLAKSVAAYQCGVAVTGKDRAVVRAK